MRKIIALALLVAALTTWVSAQSNAPTAERLVSFPVAGGSAVAVTADQALLMVGDGQENRVNVLNLQADDVLEVVEVSLDGTPIALEGVQNFALALTENDQLLVVSPDEYAVEGVGLVNFFDAPANARILNVSPDQNWGLVAGSSGYQTLRLVDAFDIELSILFETGDAPVVAAALTNDAALLVRAGSTQVETVDLTTSFEAQDAPNQLTLEVPGTAIAVSNDGSVGAVALEDNRIVIFNPASTETLSTISLDDGPVVEMAFSDNGSSRFLALRFENRPAVMVFNVSDPSNVSNPGAIVAGGTVQALKAVGDVIVLSDDSATSFFSIEP